MYAYQSNLNLKIGLNQFRAESEATTTTTKKNTCKIDPSASNAFEQFSCSLVTSNNLSNAPFVSLMRK